jgi:peptidoglycan-associated lipoprotein
MGTMAEFTRSWRPLLVAVGVAMLAACADQGSPPVVAAAPQMAGAWYQVFFDTNQADLSPRGQLIVNKVAEVVRTHDEVRVTVIGRTDRAGTATANMALSERRAELVRDALITAGVPSARIDTSWLGEGKQDVPTSGEVAQQRNRVVDIVVQEPS